MHAMSLAERLARDVVDNMYIIDTGVLVMNTCVYICVYIHIYIYIHRERERERDMLCHAIQCQSPCQQSYRDLTIISPTVISKRKLKTPLWPEILKGVV